MWCLRFIDDNDGNYGGSEYIHDVDVNVNGGEDEDVEYAQHGQKGQPAVYSYLLNVIVIIMLMVIVIIPMTHMMMMMLMLIY